MKTIDPVSVSVPASKTTLPRKGLRTGVRAGVSSDNFCPRVAAPPVLRTSIQWPYE